MCIDDVHIELFDTSPLETQPHQWGHHVVLIACWHLEAPLRAYAVMSVMQADKEEECGHVRPLGDLVSAVT